MATDVTADRAKLYRLSVRQYLKMIGAGVFPDDAHVELLGGVLVQQMTKYPPHDFTVGRLGRTLNRLLPPDWIVREEKAVELGRYWRPEPDIAIIRGPDDRYRAATPGPADIAFLVEASESSHGIDRGPKWRGYASAGIPIYWIVNLPKRQVEVYTGPTGRGQKASYQDQAIFDVRASVPLIVMGSQVGQVAVRDILP